MLGPVDDDARDMLVRGTTHNPTNPEQDDTAARRIVTV